MALLAERARDFKECPRRGGGGGHHAYGSGAEMSERRPRCEGNIGQRHARTVIHNEAELESSSRRDIVHRPPGHGHTLVYRTRISIRNETPGAARERPNSEVLITYRVIVVPRLHLDDAPPKLLQVVERPRDRSGDCGDGFEPGHAGDAAVARETSVRALHGIEAAICSGVPRAATEIGTDFDHAALAGEQCAAATRGCPRGKCRVVRVRGRAKEVGADFEGEASGGQSRLGVDETSCVAQKLDYRCRFLYGLVGICGVTESGVMAGDVDAVLDSDGHAQ